MSATLILLLVMALVVSLGIGFLAGLPPRQLAAQTVAMWAAALGFYGLVALL